MLLAKDAVEISSKNGKVAVEKYISEYIEPAIKSNASRGMRSATANRLPPTEIRELLTKVLEEAGYDAKIYYGQNQLDSSYVEIKW